MLVAIVLVGGRFYASRVSERASQVVYSASLEEVEAEELGDPRYGPLRLRLKNANAAVEAAAVEARRRVRLLHYPYAPECLEGSHPQNFGPRGLAEVRVHDPV